MDENDIVEGTPPGERSELGNDMLTGMKKLNVAGTERKIFDMVDKKSDPGKAESDSELMGDD
jgi:hypothetical protein